MCSTSCNPPYLLYAFDEALTAFEAYLDSLAETSSPDKSAGTSQVCVGRFGCLLVDYLNLIEACVTNHPDLSDQVVCIKSQLIRHYGQRRGSPGLTALQSALRAIFVEQQLHLGTPTSPLRPLSLQQ
ncbi:uncharacterized protein LOC111270811 isoform X2 [Varroa jacobsoni]|uniref:Uncharacterized protein n=1 Tax=Varroa destructor TaxID=109461 RepID=A0A7M7M3X2_VARDE|nr:uncharacterized protein LOC111244212 isoform X2 [Varroa destructor]XP_022706965.1 uncharacterized protein LOC111270811 isoform X2 [Varroa jacobsoni]